MDQIIEISIFKGIANKKYNIGYSLLKSVIETIRLCRHAAISSDICTVFRIGNSHLFILVIFPFGNTILTIHIFRAIMGILLAGGKYNG